MQIRLQFSSLSCCLLQDKFDFYGATWNNTLIRKNGKVYENNIAFLLSEKPDFAFVDVFEKKKMPWKQKVVLILGGKKKGKLG